MYSYSLVALGALASYASLCSASPMLTKRYSAPKFSVSSYSGYGADPNWPGTVTRDGGGGGTINGHNIIVFSDTSTTKPDGSFGGFTSNSAPYFNTNTPTLFTEFGSNSYPNQVIQYTANETAYKANNPDIGRILSWPKSNIAALPNGNGVFFPTVTTWNSKTNVYTDWYNSVAIVTANDSGPTFTRVVNNMFYPNEIMYGGFGTAMSVLDSNLVLYGNNAAGIFQARVDPSSVTDRSKYTYYDASTQTWSSTQPSPSNSAACIIPGDYSSGDIFYSTFYGTWLAIYFNNYADSTFYIRYSLTGKSSGPWSGEQTLYKTTPSASVYNYGAHAYWMPYGTTVNGRKGASNTVILSWTYDGAHIQFAKVTFS